MHARVTLSTVNIANDLTVLFFHDTDALERFGWWISTFLLKSSILLLCTKDGIHLSPGTASCRLDSLGAVGTTPWPLCSFSSDCTHSGGSGVNSWEPKATFGTNGGTVPKPTAGSVQGNGGAVVWFHAVAIHGRGAILPRLDKLEMVPRLDRLEIGPRLDKLEIVPRLDKLEIGPRSDKLEIVPMLDKLDIGPRLDKLEIGAHGNGGKVGNSVVFVVTVDVMVELVAVEVLEVLVDVVWVTVTVVVVVALVVVRVVVVAVVVVEVVPVVVLVLEIVDVVAVIVLLVVVGETCTSKSEMAKLDPPMLQYCWPPQADLSSQCVSPFQRDDTRTKPPLAMASATFFAALSGTPVPMGFPPSDRLNSVIVSLSWLSMTVICPVHSKDEVTLKGLEESMVLAPGL